MYERAEDKVTNVCVCVSEHCVHGALQRYKHNMHINMYIYIYMLQTFHTGYNHPFQKQFFSLKSDFLDIVRNLQAHFYFMSLMSYLYLVENQSVTETEKAHTVKPSAHTNTHTHTYTGYQPVLNKMS